MHRSGDKYVQILNRSIDALSKEQCRAMDFLAMLDALGQSNEHDIDQMQKDLEPLRDDMATFLEAAKQAGAKASSYMKS